MRALEGNVVVVVAVVVVVEEEEGGGWGFCVGPHDVSPDQPC